MKLTKGKRYDFRKLECTGWIQTVKGKSKEYDESPGGEGYNVSYYFDENGTYLGEDKFGIEPTFEEISA